MASKAKKINAQTILGYGIWRWLNIPFIVPIPTASLAVPFHSGWPIRLSMKVSGHFRIKGRKKNPITNKALTPVMIVFLIFFVLNSITGRSSKGNCFSKKPRLAQIPALKGLSLLMLMRPSSKNITVNPSQCEIPTSMIVMGLNA